MSAEVILLRHDRRHSNRLVLPPCPKCSKPSPKVMLRTDYVLYLACPQCGELWSVNKPAPPKDDMG